MGLARAVQLLIASMRLSRCFAANPLRRSGADPYFVASCVKEGLLKAFGEVRAQDKPLISKMLGNLVEVLLHQGLSLTDFRYFLYRGQGDHAVFQHNIQQLPHGDLRSFWESYDQLPPSQADMYSMGPSNRLEPLVKSKSLRRMLGQTDVSLDFKALMDDGGIAIFDLSREGAGVTVDGQHLLAALLVQEFRQVLETRTPDASRPFTLILDEFGDYTSADFARVLTAARKFGMRCVFSHQHMGQLLLADQDRTLFDAVLAIPNKVMFGELPFDQAELLAKQTYLRLLSPDKIQYQPRTIVWDPVPTKVKLSASARADGEVDASGGGSGHSSASRNSGGIESAETITEASHWAFTSQKTFSETEHEAWVTFYKKRIQDGTPVFEELEKQVFRFAQKLNTNPRGTCVVATAEMVPRECRVPLMKAPDLSAVEKQRYLAWVYEKPFYLDPAEADRRIEARQMKLLEAAPPPEGRVKRPRGKAMIPSKAAPESS